jgi:chaperonin GroEL (HSP60 family)
LNVELELKAEKDNAEVRVDNVEEYQKVVDAEWNILYEKLDLIVKSGAKVVLSKLPIGDVATQVMPQSKTAEFLPKLNRFAIFYTSGRGVLFS